MEVYTLYNKQVDNLINKKLEMVVDVLKDSTPNVCSIILAGGYGKGEGIIKKTSNKIELVSDFDIFVITDSRLSNKIMKHIYQKIKKKISHYDEEIEIDVRYFEKNKLKKVAPILRFYDLKYASKVIYGDDVRGLIPIPKEQNLPVYEGVRLLFNRIGFFAEWFSLKEIKTADKKLKHELVMESTKTYSICCQALNILMRDYQPKLIDCINGMNMKLNKTYPEFYNKNKELVNKICYFTKIRLKYDEDKINNIENPEKLWLDSIADLLIITKFFLEQFAGINGWDEAYKKVSKIYLKEHVDYISSKRWHIKISNFLFNLLSTIYQARANMSWFFKVLYNNKKFYLKALADYRDPVIKIYFSGLFAMLSIKSNRINKNYFDKSVYYLKKAYPFCLKGKDDLEQFDSLFGNFRDAHKLRLCLKKFATLHKDNIIITFRNFN